MKRLIGIVLGLIVIVSTIAPVMAASWQLNGTACGGYMVVNSMCMTEDANAGGEEMFLLQGDTGNTDLHIAVTVGDHECEAAFFVTDWNDCISYVRFNIGSGHVGCLYDNTNATGVILKLKGPWNGAANLSTGNDAASMVNIHTGTTC